VYGGLLVGLKQSALVRGPANRECPQIAIWIATAARKHAAHNELAIPKEVHLAPNLGVVDQLAPKPRAVAQSRELEQQLPVVSRAQVVYCPKRMPFVFHH
jgi:hypothetical protein